MMKQSAAQTGRQRLGLSVTSNLCSRLKSSPCFYICMVDDLVSRVGLRTKNLYLVAEVVIPIQHVPEDVNPQGFSKRLFLEMRCRGREVGNRCTGFRIESR